MQSGASGAREKWIQEGGTLEAQITENVDARRRRSGKKKEKNDDVTMACRSRVVLAYHCWEIQLRSQKKFSAKKRFGSVEAVNGNPDARFLKQLICFYINGTLRKNSLGVGSARHSIFCRMWTVLRFGADETAAV